MDLIFIWSIPLQSFDSFNSSSPSAWCYLHRAPQCKRRPSLSGIIWRPTNKLMNRRSVFCLWRRRRVVLFLLRPFSVWRTAQTKRSRGNMMFLFRLNILKGKAKNTNYDSLSQIFTISLKKISSLCSELIGIYSWRWIHSASVSRTLKRHVCDLSSPPSEVLAAGSGRGLMLEFIMREFRSAVGVGNLKGSLWIVPRFICHGNVECVWDDVGWCVCECVWAETVITLHRNNRRFCLFCWWMFDRDRDVTVRTGLNHIPRGDVPLFIQPEAPKFQMMLIQSGLTFVVFEWWRIVSSLSWKCIQSCR